MPKIQYSDQPSLATKDEQTEAPPTSLVSHRLRGFFAEQGLPRHKHASELAVILGLSRSGAFRKFQDGAFSAADLESLAQHFRVDISQLLSDQPADASCGDGEMQAASLVIGGHSIACKALIGTELGRHEHSELVATLQDSAWRVQPYAAVDSVHRHHRIHKVTIIPAQRQLPRLAVLEDSADLAANLKDAFTAAGFRVELFSSATALSQESAIAPFDAYVIDWWLDGTTSAAVLQTIRKAQPSAPLILTTGAIANGNAAEDEIARLSMAHRIQIIEKPFRLTLLISQVKLLLGETS